MNKEKYIFGIRAIMEAIKSGKEIEKVFLRKGAGGNLFQSLFEMIRKEHINFQMVPIEKLNKITTDNHQGAIAMLSEISYANLEEVIERIKAEEKTPLFLILDRVSDVRNFGAIARSAEVAGVDAIIVPDKGAAQANADAIKTSAGALHTIPVCKYRNLKDAVMLFQQYEIQCIGASEKASENYFDNDLTQPIAIVMGSEDQGITPGLLKMLDGTFKIPQLGKIESLNVSVAASIIVFDAVRQRMSK